MAQTKKCPNPNCGAEPATGCLANPIGGSWYFTCSKCGFGIKVDQQLD